MESLERDPCFNESECDIDKAWNILCFLLYGESCATWKKEVPFPANFLLDRNDAIDEDMVPLGIFAAGGQQIADFLDSQIVEQLRTRFIPSALHKADAYPSGWDRYDDEKGTEWVEEWEQWVFTYFEDM